MLQASYLAGNGGKKTLQSSSCGFMTTSLHNSILQMRYSAQRLQVPRLLYCVGACAAMRCKKSPPSCKCKQTPFKAKHAESERSHQTTQARKCRTRNHFSKLEVPPVSNNSVSRLPHPESLPRVHSSNASEERKVARSSKHVMWRITVLAARCIKKPCDSQGA